MRKLSLFLFFQIFLTHLNAQDPPVTSIDSMLTNIDHSTFTSGVLYDRVNSWAQLDIFNDSLNSASKNYFEQALLEIHNSSNQEKFISHKSLRNSYVSDTITNKADIGIINVLFHELNYNLDNENAGALRLVDDQFELIANGEPPFIENHIFMVSPLKTYLLGEAITFKTDNGFLIEDAPGRTIIDLMANFDSGNEVVIMENGVISNSEVTIAYSEPGYKTLSFTATFENGSTLTTQAVIHVKLAQPAQDPLIEDGSVWGDIPYQGFNETEAYIGKLDYRIFYHTNNGNTQKNLLKPIVIIDGFDPGDKRKIQDSDSNLPEDLHISIEDIMVYYDDQGVKKQIIDELRNIGYDVVIVNHPNHWANGFKIDGGADYIERNALTHVKLYQLLNSILLQNNSNEELVIVGPSMGGQISRYALAYMEKNSIPHNTRLWVSLDSPHLGANIPLGVQSLINTIYGSSASAQDFWDNQLGSAAARQQLIEQYSNRNGTQLNQYWLDGRTISQGFSENKGRPIYINYYNNLFNNGLPGSNGYPQNLRKIALINGSLFKKKLFDNPFVPGGTDFSGTTNPENYGINGLQSLKIEGYGNVIGHLATMETYFMPGYGNNHKISFFKSKGVLGWKYFDRFVTNNNSRGNMDIIPGGWFPSQRELAYSIENSVPCEWIIGQVCINDWTIETIKHVNSFIPTVSSLGFNNPDFNWNQSMNRNLVCTGEIPFDTYYGPGKNEQHTSFTENSINWLMEELAGNPQAPTVYLNGSDLLGPEAICQNDIVTYEFGACTAAPVPNWEVSGNMQILTYDDYSVTVEYNGSYSGSGFIKAIYPYHTVQKDIWLGRPSSPGYLNGPEIVSTGSLVTYSGGESVGATSYEWWLPYPFEVVYPFDYLGDNWQVSPNAGRSTQLFTGNAGNNGYVQLMGKNSCGNGDAVMIYVEHGNGGGGDPPIPVVPYPNTTDESFNLDFSSYPVGIYQIKIYDNYSNIIYDGESSNIEKTISTIDIPNGTYFLYITIDGELTIFQLVVDH
jgi:pimeloyl-ACP methyl ester carboxylesterase